MTTSIVNHTNQLSIFWNLLELGRATSKCIQTTNPAYTKVGGVNQIGHLEISLEITSKSWVNLLWWALVKKTTIHRLFWYYFRVLRVVSYYFFHLGNASPPLGTIVEVLHAMLQYVIRAYRAYWFYLIDIRMSSIIEIKYGPTFRDLES